MSLWQIDHLIELTDYSTALQQLSLYIKKYPDQFDKAQKRVSKILKARSAYNNQAIELAEKMRLSAEGENLTDEEINELDVQKMDIIVALEKSEENPPLEEVNLTNDARRTVRLSYYINRSNIIVNQGSSLVASGNLDSKDNYTGAIEKFKEGLTLKTNDSDIVFNGDEEIPVVYSASFNKDVDSHIQNIRNYSLSISKNMDDCQTAYEKYCAALESNVPSQAVSAFSEVKTSFERLASVRNMLYKEGKVLADLDHKALELNPGLGDTSYVTFSRWAVTGVDSNPDSGIIGAIDGFWNTRTESMKQKLYETVRKNFESVALGLDFENGIFNSTDYAALNTSRRLAGEFAGFGSQIHGLYSLLTDSNCAGFTQYNQSMDFASMLAKNNFRTLLSAVRNIQNQNTQVAERKVVNNDFTKFGDDCIASASFYEKELLTLGELKNNQLLISEKEIQSQIENNESNESNESNPVQEKARTTAGIQVKDEILSWKENIELYDSVISVSEEECKKQAGHVWSLVAQTYSLEADNQLLAFTLRNAQAQNLLNGVEEETNGIRGTRYYPSRAAEECVKLNLDISKQRNILSQYRFTLDGGVAYKESEPLYSAGIENIERVITALNDLVVNNNQVISQARVKANQAAKATNRARQAYDQAVKFLNKNQYEEARSSLDEARESYLLSLSLEENQEFRRQFGPMISATDEEITVKRNEWVITTVRHLINDAYNDYYSGSFENSKRNLDEASVVWEKTQINANAEIEELMTLVLEALESTGGKEIAFSDPLYKDMGAYLSNASNHYEEGAKLYEKGSKDEGLALLTQARDEVRKVQRVFPKNLEANNLTLKITRILDPDVYASTVAERIKKAKSEAGSPKESDQKNALNDLKELQAVIGNVPELTAAIREVETAIKRNAQSEQRKAELARSDALTKQAQKETNITRKIALLDEALKLNKRNTQAQTLKDKALTQKSTSTAETTLVKNYLEDYDEPVYALAERYYNDGRKDEALKLINELYKRNPQVPKVRKLKSRIENM